MDPPFSANLDLFEGPQSVYPQVHETWTFPVARTLTPLRVFRSGSVTASWLAFCASLPACTPAQPPTASDRTVLVHNLPPAFGRNPRIEVLDVQYGPGGRSGPHRHGCPVVGYVLEGTLRTKLQGGPVQVFGPGEAFYENPTDIHEISENARSGGATRFLAIFVCDDDRPLSTKVEHAVAK